MHDKCRIEINQYNIIEDKQWTWKKRCQKVRKKERKKERKILEVAQ